MFIFKNTKYTKYTKYTNYTNYTKYASLRPIYPRKSGRENSHFYISEIRDIKYSVFYVGNSHYMTY